MQRAVGIGHALDGADIGAVGLHREHGAALHGLAVEIDGAGPAMAGLAADMRAGETELLAQEMNEQGARLDQLFDGLAVHRHLDVGFGHCALPILVVAFSCGKPASTFPENAPSHVLLLWRGPARARASRRPSWCGSVPAR